MELFETFDASDDMQDCQCQPASSGWVCLVGGRVGNLHIYKDSKEIKIFRLRHFAESDMTMKMSKLFYGD